MCYSVKQSRPSLQNNINQTKCISLNSLDNEKGVFSVSDIGSSAEKIRVFPMGVEPIILWFL